MFMNTVKQSGVGGHLVSKIQDVNYPTVCSSVGQQIKSGIKTEYSNKWGESSVYTCKIINAYVFKALDIF